MKLQWYERRGMLTTIVYLYRVGKANQTSIAKATGVTNDTLKNSVLPTLEKKSFIKKDSKQVFPFETTILLTEKGRKAASYLSETGIFLVS